MKRLIFGALAALAALVLLPAGAMAKDGNDDGLPDRWERKHHLSLKVKQGRKDQDRDGVRNKSEFKHGTSPRDEDSDDDGTEDGDEAGTITSFDASSGKLVIRLLNGDEVSGKVTSKTEIECEASDDDFDAKASRRGEEDEDEDEGEDEDEDEGDDRHGGDEDKDHGGRGDDDDRDHDRDCGTEALTTGARVHEAELEISGSRGAVWREIELVS